MENGAPEVPVRPRILLAELFGPEALKGPGVLPLAAAGHVALITSAQPETLSTLWQMAALNPVLALASVVIVALASVQLSRLFEERMYFVRRVTIGLIAGCLSLLAGDLMSMISADQQPWAAIIAGATVVVLVGGLTTLIADARTLSDR